MQGFAVGHWAQVGVRGQAQVRHVLARCGQRVLRTAAAQVVAMRVRDDGAVHWLPRIDVEVAHCAVQDLRTGDDEIAHVNSPSLRE